jgi:hypothetical protein
VSTTATIVVVLVVLAVIVAIAAFALRQRRGPNLRERFGPEYDRTVQETGSRQEAERVLAQRVERRRQLDIRELQPEERQRYSQEWLAVQSRFVDDPKGAVGEADNLVSSVMRARGYPIEDFDQQAADVSVDHASAVPDFRQAHEVLTSARGDVATDDLRQAMVHYRALFEQLVGERVTATDRSSATAVEDRTAADAVPPQVDERPVDRSEVTEQSVDRGDVTGQSVDRGEVTERSVDRGEVR